MTNEFIDISEFQKNVNFHEVKASGIHGVMIRATYGSKSIDHLLDQHVHGAREAGLPVAFYHYAYPDLHHADVEAVHFCEVVAHYGRGISLMLDMEEKQGLSSYVHWSRTFNHVCFSRLHVWPYFYSYIPYIDAMAPATPIGRGLIVANYGVNDGKYHPISPPVPWKHLAGHQYTSKGQVNGVPGKVDRNRAFTDIFGTTIGR